MAAARERPELVGLNSAFRADVPQVKFELDRDKAKTLGVPINEVYESLQIYLGGMQVNDLTLFGRPFKVMVQAEPEFRMDPDNLRQIYVRSHGDTMVPLRTMSTVDSTTGPDLIHRYNMFRVSEITGASAPGYSSGQAIAVMEDVAAEVLDEGWGYEWTTVAYQEKAAGGAQTVIFALGFLLVFLFLGDAGATVSAALFDAATILVGLYAVHTVGRWVIGAPRAAAGAAKLAGGRDGTSLLRALTRLERGGKRAWRERKFEEASASPAC